MHTIGNYAGASRSLEGDLIVSFSIDDQEIKLDKETDYVIDIKKHSEKRSLSANAYFWKLCDSIAKVVKSDKYTIYLLQLSKYGCFVDVEVIKEALPALKQKFRYVEELDDGLIEMRPSVTARCYFGSSHYSKKEMSDLIDGTVRDAQDLGIETWTDEEIRRLIKDWEGDSYGVH